jgi:Na+/melibiose symporter-like transporter
VQEEHVSRGVVQHFREILAMFKNRAFQIVTLLFLCCWLAINFITNNLFLYVKYALNLESHFSWLLLTIQGTAAVFLFFWSWVRSVASGRRTHPNTSPPTTRAAACHDD